MRGRFYGTEGLVLMGLVCMLREHEIGGPNGSTRLSKQRARSISLLLLKIDWSALRRLNDHTEQIGIKA